MLSTLNADTEPGTESDMDAAYSFARNFANTKYENLPSDVVEATKKEFWTCWRCAGRGVLSRERRMCASS